jgi:hypothetical protein
MIKQLFSLSLLLLSSIITAQESIKCYSTEHEHELQHKYQHRADLQEFENWISKIQRDDQMKSQRGVVTLPIVFHVLHSGQSVGNGLNISSALINAQLEQINDDFRRKPGTAGFNTNPVGADLEIEFCMAVVDPQGNLLAEPGIDRINAPSIGLQAPGYTTNYMDNQVKPVTIWDPERYVNVWITPINLFFFNVLGYAQFPSASGLPGLNANEGLAQTDGVVVTTESVGSISLPNPAGGATGAGRTLTHELGHFFGLRHIWGDGGCGVDDFCTDTPTADGSNSGCQVGSISCGSADMVENYMDYSNDACMNIFTLDQKARVDAVLLNSPRRVELLSSNACSTDVPDCAQPYPAVSNLSSTTIGNGVLLSWSPIEGSIGCQIRAGLSSIGFQTTVTAFGENASEFFVPSGAIQAGAEYQWQVRCGCSSSPLVVGPWSQTSFFSFGSGITEFGSGQSGTNSFTLFPNPAQDFLTLKGESLVNYSIFDLNGRLIQEQVLNGSGYVNERIDISTLDNGLYLFSVTDVTGKIHKEKVLVNRFH